MCKFSRKHELLEFILESAINSQKEILLFFSGGNHTSERLSNLPQIIQHFTGRRTSLYCWHLRPYSSRELLYFKLQAEKASFFFFF